MLVSGAEEKRKGQGRTKRYDKRRIGNNDVDEVACGFHCKVATWHDDHPERGTSH